MGAVRLPVELSILTNTEKIPAPPVPAPPRLPGQMYPKLAGVRAWMSYVLMIPARKPHGSLFRPWDEKGLAVRTARIGGHGDPRQMGNR